MSTRPSKDLLPGEYTDCYDEMLAAIGRDYDGAEKLTAFWPLVGSEYKAGSGTLIVGRAPNQWGVAYDVPAKKLQDAGRRRSIVKELREDHDTQSFDWWIEHYNPDAQRRLGRQPTATRSAFFRVAGKATSTAWSRLAWSNLYKVAPAKGRNPGASLQAAQGSLARELFHKEIDALDPKTILVLAGSDWFDNFQNREGLTFKKAPRCDFVQGVANVGGRRWIVARHPERKPQAPFVEEVKRCLGADGRGR